MAKLEAMDVLHSISTSACEGSNNLFINSKLPLELFLRMATFLPARALILATHVCSNWRRNLINHPKLWQVLRVDISNLDSLEEVRAYAARAKGSLSTIILDCNKSRAMDSDILRSLPINALVKSLCHEISQLDGARKLFSFTIDLTAYGDDTTNVYAILFIILNFIQYAAVHLEKLVIKGKAFPASVIFSTALSLKELTLISTGPAVVGARGEEFPVNNLVGESQMVVCNIRDIFLYGSLLNDPLFPASFPHLTRLVLSNMTIPNLYGLLEKAATSLRILILGAIKSEAPAQFQATPTDGSTKDVVPILVLPKLIDLHITSHSPNLWKLPAAVNDGGGRGGGGGGANGDFMISAPALKVLKLSDLTVVDEESEEDINNFSAWHNLTPDTMINLFRQSPSLEELDISGIGFSSEMMLSGFVGVPTTLKKLRLCQVGSDNFLERLDVIAPNLELLDLRECDGNYAEEDSTITLPAIARLVSRYVKVRGDNLKLEIIHEDFDDDEEEEMTVGKLQIELVNSLFLLSPAQLELLVTATLTINPSPNSAPYHVQRQEILSLAVPPKRMEMNQIFEGGRVRKVVATNDVFVGCQSKLIRWQGKRERVAAENYCKSKGVILKTNDDEAGGDKEEKLERLREVEDEDDDDAY